MKIKLKNRKNPGNQTPCHSSFSGGDHLRSTSGSFAVRDHLRSILGIICGRGSFAALYKPRKKHFLKFTYLWHIKKGLLPKPFSNYFQYASNVHKYNTRYAWKQNLFVEKVRTNMRKQTIGYAPRVIWDEIPLKRKELSVYQLSKQLKPYLLSEQHN